MNLTTYTADNLMDTIADDRWSVRDEAARRHEALARKIAKAKARLAALEAEAAKIEAVFVAATNA